MLYFECDYNNGCHPKILESLSQTNDIRQPGYGEDCFTEAAKAKIREDFACPDADIFFLGGGTQTNLVVISSMLRSYEGVIAAQTGHVNGHESGAIEYTGHKVLTLPHHEGKISASDLKDYLESYYSDSSYEHMVFPGMVYISYPTEYGTLYSKQELSDISSVCREYKLPLFIDGARLGYGLMSAKCDITPAQLQDYCDVFYIGGTKVGALCGEAVVFPKGNAPEHFFSSIKQHGALFAKGRTCAVQFDTLFTDGLYWQISRNAIDTAELMKDLLRDRGYPFFKETPTNQQFVIIPNEKLAELQKNVNISLWEKYDADNTVVRFCTSWATEREEIAELAKYL